MTPFSFGIRLSCEARSSLDRSAESRVTWLRLGHGALHQTAHDATIYQAGVLGSPKRLGRGNSCECPVVRIQCSSSCKQHELCAFVNLIAVVVFMAGNRPE